MQKFKWLVTDKNEFHGIYITLTSPNIEVTIDLKDNSLLAFFDTALISKDIIEEYLNVLYKYNDKAGKGEEQDDQDGLAVELIIIDYKQLLSEPIFNLSNFDYISILDEVNLLTKNINIPELEIISDNASIISNPNKEGNEKVFVTKTSFEVGQLVGVRIGFDTEVVLPGVITKEQDNIMVSVKVFRNMDMESFYMYNINTDILYAELVNIEDYLILFNDMSANDYHIMDDIPNDELFYFQDGNRYPLIEITEEDNIKRYITERVIELYNYIYCSYWKKNINSINEVHISELRKSFDYIDNPDYEYIRMEIRGLYAIFNNLNIPMNPNIKEVLDECKAWHDKELK